MVFVWIGLLVIGFYYKIKRYVQKKCQYAKVANDRQEVSEANGKVS